MLAAPLQSGAALKKKKNILRDNLMKVTPDALKRLARQAGVKTMSRLVFEQIRGVMSIELGNILRETIIHAERARRMTVQPKDVMAALEHHWLATYPTAKEAVLHRCKTYESTRKKNKKKSNDDDKQKTGRRFRQGLVAIREIRHYQGQSNCTMIPRVTMSRLIREVGQDFKFGLRFSAEALGLIHISMEAYIIDMLEDAQQVAIHAGRIMVMPKDIHIVRKVYHAEF